MRARGLPRALLMSGCALLAGCNVGPNFHRPQVPIPPAYRGASPVPPPLAQGESLGNLTWKQVFTDPDLQRLIRIALAQNQDLALAALRIERERARVRLARLQDVPQLNGSANYTEQQLSQEGLPADKVAGDPEGSAVEGNVAFSWEIDFWGRYRRLHEAARARLLASQAAQQALRVSLVAAVASAYFRLREYDTELAYSQQSLKLRQQSLRLTQAREQGGVSSLLDVRQAQTLVTEAQESITRLERLIAQEENALHILLAEDPGPVTRPPAPVQEHVADLPPGMPSELLERRPDIREAEENLHAANADIGAVRAEYFPNLSLTGMTGTESSAFHNLFAGGADAWLVQPALNVPVFTGGRIGAREQEAQATEKGALIAYAATVRQAFREVSDALIARQRMQAFFSEQEQEVATAESAAFLSRARYQGGVAGYLEVLETERTSLAAKLNLAHARYDELNASVQLFRALGGGWRP